MPQLRGRVSPDTRIATKMDSGFLSETDGTFATFYISLSDSEGEIILAIDHDQIDEFTDNILEFIALMRTTRSKTH